MNQGVIIGIDYGAENSAEDGGVYCLYEREGDKTLFKRVLTQDEYHAFLNTNETMEQT